MAQNIPTTQEIKDSILTGLESILAQTAPLNDKAFLRVLSAVLAMAFTTLYKFGVNETLQSLAITATGSGLNNIGQEYGVIRKPAEAAILTIELPGTNGTIIPATIDYVGDANSVRYRPDTSVTISGGVAISNVTAQTLGVVGNLNVSDTMTIGTQVAGAETVATVTVVVNTGAEVETDDAYRARILNAIRSTTGGGNATDHKIWSEEVAGVKQAYPYSGRPESPLPGIDTGASVPPDRTVFVEADESIDPDGIATTALKDEVRASINNDPVTGDTRPPLGLTDSTLSVETITRTSLYVRITGFDEGTGEIATVKSNIETALTTYFKSVKMYVVAIDDPGSRNDTITAVSISQVVMDVLETTGGSATLIEFDDDAGFGSLLTTYTLEEGELAKLGATPTYV